MSGMVNVQLHGHLGNKYGGPFELAVRSPLEAIMALEANFPGFRKEFLKAERYYILVDGDCRSGREGIVMPASKEIHLVPDVEGGGLETLLVSGLVAASGGFLTTTTASIIVGVLVTALMVGLSLLLAPKPKKDTKDDKKEDSFIFSGSDATIGQGAPVPLIYGRCWVPPTVISAGLETGDEKIEGSSGGGGTNSPWSP